MTATTNHCEDLDPADAGSISEALKHNQRIDVTSIVDEDNVLIMINGHVVGSVSVDWTSTTPTEHHNSDCDVWDNEHCECPGFDDIDADVILTLSRKDIEGDPKTSVRIRTW